MRVYVDPLPPEEPWWWPLGPAAVVWVVVVALLVASSVWPLSPAGARMVDTVLNGLAIAGAISWVAALIGLRVRHGKRTAPIPVVVDGEGVRVDGRSLRWDELSRVEWSPFGLLVEDGDGRRSHVPAQVTDDLVTELQAACDAARSGVQQP